MIQLGNMPGNIKKKPTLFMFAHKLGWFNFNQIKTIGMES